MESLRRTQSKKRRRWLSAIIVIVVAILILVIRLVEDIGPERRPGDRFAVAKIIDGDTVELLGGDRLRLLAIDTPEEGDPYHDEAAALLGRLTLGHTGTIEFAGRRRDRYGRLLGYLFIDSVFINRAMIDSGMGYVYLFSGNELASLRVAELLAAQRQAINVRRGIWSIEREPEVAYYARIGSFRLHRPGCRSINLSSPERYVQYETREEGLSTGLSPCRNCKP